MRPSSLRATIESSSFISPPMPPGKRILFYLLMLAASFVLLNSVIFLMHSVYRPPSWSMICQSIGTASACLQNEDKTFSINATDIYRLNIQGAFYLIAILTICFAPFLSRKDLFPPLLYSFGGFAALFALFASKKEWFFEVGSDTPDAISSILLFLICLCASYLLYKRAEAVLDWAYATTLQEQRDALAKPRKKKSENRK
jgi:hypothetical protein